MRRLFALTGALLLSGCISPALRRAQQVMPAMETLVIEQAAAQRSGRTVEVSLKVSNDACDTIEAAAYLMGWEVNPLRQPNPCASMTFHGVEEKWSKEFEEGR